MAAVFSYIPLRPALRVYVSAAGISLVGGWLCEAQHQALRNGEPYGYVVRFFSGATVTVQAERVRPAFDLIEMFGLANLPSQSLPGSSPPS